MSLIDISALRHALGFAETPQQRLTRQLRALSHEVAGLSHQAARYGVHRLDDAGHGIAQLAGLVMHQAVGTAAKAGRTAQWAGASLRRDPLPALVMMGTTALLMRLFLARDQRSR
jgi:hypothetical protein